jgi:hypothetical protein
MIAPEPQTHAHNLNSKFRPAICFTLSYIGCMLTVVVDNCLIVFCQHRFYHANNILLIVRPIAKNQELLTGGQRCPPLSDKGDFW